MSAKRIRFTLLGLAVSVLVAGCGAAPESGGPAATAPAATAPAAAAPTSAPPTAEVSTGIPILAPSPTATAAATAPPATTPAGGAEPAYLDDRSTARALLDSFYNAINRHEFARAYGYWQPDAPDLQPYPVFEQGYRSTSSVQVTYGAITGDSGAGQARFAVPVALAAQANGGVQHFVGCYTLHLASPAAQATPPFAPLAIESAAVQPAAAAPGADALARACPIQGAPVATPGDTGSIDSSVYLDSRTDAVRVVRSFYNAINRREYLRAYSYWQEQFQVPALPDFTAGYSTTQSVALTTGDVLSDAGAGQRNYRLPVTITAQQSDGSAQTFAGCYFLHLAVPATQEPPFTPLGIVGANIQPVTADASAASLMAEGCRVVR